MIIFQCSSLLFLFCCFQSLLLKKCFLQGSKKTTCERGDCRASGSRQTKTCDEISPVWRDCGEMVFDDSVICPCVTSMMQRNEGRNLTIMCDVTLTRCMCNEMSDEVYVSWNSFPFSSFFSGCEAAPFSKLASSLLL